MALALCALLLLLLVLAGRVARATPVDPQHILSAASFPANIPQIQVQSQTPARKLQGRFLHITDPFYKTNSSIENSCHSGSGNAGFLGAPATECDTPISLVNATFQWINDTLKDQIDFVIWTGDSARHDNDESFPRSVKQVQSLNEFLVDKFVEVFGKDDNLDDEDPTNDFIVPIVPTFGNNDVLPHNIFQPGPNKWTKKYTSIWRKFIPEEQRHSFERGGWFFTEVIPNKLAVFSLNTLYFFDSNSAVDGCDSKSQPGYEHMEWLRIQLQFLRDRGMKAIMTGHVPPARTESKQNWDDTCWQKYNLWMRQYRDVVIAGLWGHMNIDHFMFQDSNEVMALLDEGERAEFAPKVATKFQKRHMSVKSSTDYLQELREGWMNLPTPPSGMSYLSIDDDETVDTEKKRKKKKGKQADFLKEIGGKWAERFSLSLASPSLVPNYFPTIRVVEYNITGLEDIRTGFESSDSKLSDHSDFAVHEHEELRRDCHWKDETESPQDESSIAKKKKNHRGKKPKKPSGKLPKPPSKTSPPGPGYSPQTLSLLSYTQYFANLTTINAAKDAAMIQGGTARSAIETNSKHGNNDLNDYREFFKFEVEYDTKNYSSKYSLKDLTVRSYLDLAQHLGKKHMKLKLGPGISLPEVEVDACSQESSDDFQAQLKAEERNSEAKKHHNGKKGKSSGTKLNDLWMVFLRRAYVNARTDDELQDSFG